MDVSAVSSTASYDVPFLFLVSYWTPTSHHAIASTRARDKQGTSKRQARDSREQQSSREKKRAAAQQRTADVNIRRQKLASSMLTQT